MGFYKKRHRMKRSSAHLYWREHKPNHQNSSSLRAVKHKWKDEAKSLMFLLIVQKYCLWLFSCTTVARYFLQQRKYFLTCNNCEKKNKYGRKNTSLLQKTTKIVFIKLRIKCLGKNMFSVKIKCYLSCS